MTKQEFQKRIGAEISQKDYSIVEHVYTWHPSISEVEGKEQIAELYKSFGMPIIKNMMEAANYAETLDRAMAQAQRQVEELRKRIIRVPGLSPLLQPEDSCISGIHACNTQFSAPVHYRGPP